MLYHSRMINVRRGPFDQVDAELYNFFKQGDTLAVRYTSENFALFVNDKQYSSRIDITPDEGGYYLIDTIKGRFFLERNEEDYFIMPARTYKDINGETQFCPDDSNKLRLKKIRKPFIGGKNCACSIPYGKRCNRKMGQRPLNAGI